MARARNIKPGFFKNEELGELPPAVRLFFVGLWCVADREGRFEDRPRRLWAEIMPYDQYEGEAAMEQLAERGFVVRYEVCGVRYAQIVNFLKHQAPHCKEAPSIIPEPAAESTGKGCDEHLESTGKGGDEHPLDPLIPGLLDLAPTAHSRLAAPKRPAVPVQAIIDAYHELLPMCPQVRKLTETRRRQIEARWRAGDLPDVETWRDYFAFCAQSKFLTGLAPVGPGQRPFIADLEWWSREGNYAKVYERKYHR